MKRVVIVGAGVVGVGCAYYLQRAGLPVTLIDQGTVGGACSHANCGFVCPSHVLPLAGPGVIGKTLRTLLQKNSPLSIRIRFDPSLWGWFLRFARRCTRSSMLEAGHALQALLDSSRGLYGELMTTENIEAEWQERGLMFVFRTQKEMDHYAETDKLLRQEFGRGADRHDGDRLLELEPALKPGLAGAWHYRGDAHLRPDRLMASWRALLESRGVTIRERCGFQGLATQRRQVIGVETSAGPLPAEAVVIATGAWTPLLQRHLGGTIPIQPGKGYSITMPRPARCPTYPMLFEEDRVAVTPMASGYRIGSTMEFAGYDESLNRRRLDLLLQGAAHYLHEPTAAPVQEEWWGWRPMVPDGKPIIGRALRWDNVFLATGHGMLGLSMATGTGKLVTELLTGSPPHIDPAPYAPGRF